MLSCKKCLSEKIVKNGITRDKQRYKCRACGYNFVEGDQRTNDTVATKKALCTILYTISKTSLNTLSHIFDTWPSLIYRWIEEAGVKLSPTEQSEKIKEIKFDEMWRFIESKKEKFDLSKPLTVANGELWPGCPVILIMQSPKDSATKTNT